MVYIGIDLGTTYSCAAIIEDGRPVVIPNDNGKGKNIVPSVVAFTEEEILVGSSALDSNTDLSNILYDSKRLIGWEIFNDLLIADDRQLWTFDVNTRNNYAGYILNKGKSNEKFILPEEVSAKILKYLKDQVEKYTNQKVTKAVVTVPASFNERQITATKRAAELAGLKLKGLLQEPIAIIIAYMEKHKLRIAKILIFDLGGGTLNISIAQIKLDGYELKAIAGDPHLGGQDFDSRIMKYVIEEFRKTSDYDIFKKPRLVKRLRAECRNAKESLSFSNNPVNVHLEINDGVAINVQLSMEKLNELCSDLFDRAMVYVDKALNTARISSSQLDYVILVGGSTRIPEIRHRLGNRFGRSKLKSDINPDEVVAYGAAIIADAILFYLYYRNNYKDEGRICLFNSSTCSFEEIAKFHSYYDPYLVATTQNKIFGISGEYESFEIYDLNTQQISRGPDPPEWRDHASVAYFKDKLYYLGGENPKSYYKYSNRVDVLIDGKWQTGPAFPLPIRLAQTITCDGILYVIDGRESGKIYRLSDDERKWIKIRKIPVRHSFGVASLNGRIYITGGQGGGSDVLKSCLCFDPSAPVDSQISRIADMNYARRDHSLIVTNRKLYAIGGFKENYFIPENFCNLIEEYDPAKNEWKFVGSLQTQSNLPRTFTISDSNKEINILILGETGVGKSTWINGFANYLTFQTLKEAEEGKQVCLVPSQFIITGSNYQTKTIRVGEEKNESFEVGASSTQEPKSYVFNNGKRNIRLIDTPGIGDCRGADQDKKNFSSILRYISQIPEIHGICILLKPNNSRMNIVFKYCINELLTHLHVSAADNIAFCFTNARGTFYRPGDTLPVLTKYLGDLKTNRGIEIVTNRETIYCMDNESFRFLCCLHTGEQFTDREHQNFEESWTQSVREIERLLEHFEMDVKPHSVGQTVSLNEARTLILTLAKPLADVTQNIQDNIVVINAEEEKIKELDLKSDGLQKNLMIPKIDFEIKQLDHPRTVCTGIKCIATETLPDLGITKTIYRTICHDPCHCCLENVIPETVPNPALQKCNAMNTSLNCKTCSCSWEMHMHIMFEQEKVEVMVEDPLIKEALQECQDFKKLQKIAIKRLNELVKKYKEEQKTINEICAKFGAFLKEHAILAYNDAIEDYLKFDIGEAKRQGNNKKSSEILQKVERLEKQLDEYRETKRILDLNMQLGHTKKVEVAEIKKMQKELEQLELTGKEIKKLFDATVYGQQTNFHYTETHFDDSKYRKERHRPYTPNQGNFQSEMPEYSSGKQRRSYFSRAKDWFLGNNR